MRKKRRRATAKTSVEDEIVHLRGLDLKGLRARWQSVLQRPAPDHLPRHLLFAIISYRIQADRFGELDHETRQLLDRTSAKETGAAMSARLASFDQKRTELTPGTVLVREWDRRSQQVILHHPGIQKCPDELQQLLVLDALGDLAHQFVMIDSIENFFQVEINHPSAALRNIPLRLSHGVMRRPTRSEPIAVLGERWIPLPLQNLHHRLLDKAIQHGWDAKLSHQLAG
jgi:hypothetical protein